MRLLEWLKTTPSHTRRAQRHPCVLAAHYWNGGTSSAVKVRDISVSGAYLCAPEPWYVGTILNVTLQCESDENGSGDGKAETPGSFTVPCKVARHGHDGMGVSFMFAKPQDRKAMQRFVDRVASFRKKPLLFQSQAGQALIEFALMVPLLFLVIFNVVNFGGFLYSWITISNAARAGGQYAAMGAAYASYPAQATLSNITTLIQQETSSLPGSSASNPAVTVCENLNGTSIAYPQTTPTAACPAGTAPPQDPETVTGLAGASTYTTVAIDVTYTYTPFIGSFSTGLLGIVSPPTTVHRRTVMRLLN
jgi:Flp pilus assembly protein TadG